VHDGAGADHGPPPSANQIDLAAIWANDTGVICAFHADESAGAKLEIRQVAFEHVGRELEHLFPHHVRGLADRASDHIGDAAGHW